MASSAQNVGLVGCRWVDGITGGGDNRAPVSIKFVIYKSTSSIVLAVVSWARVAVVRKAFCAIVDATVVAVLPDFST
jgi:hypothetical protein